MPLTADDLAEVRKLVGSATPPTDADLDAIYDRLGTVADVALEVLQGRYADLLAGPAKYSVEGDFSVDATANLKALAGVIDDLKSTTGESPTLTVHSLTRADPWR